MMSCLLWIETGKQNGKLPLKEELQVDHLPRPLCIDEDRIFAVGSNRVFCVDKESGKVIGIELRC